MSLATNLKRHRVRKQLSLQKLAVLVGVSKAHIWDLETARAKNPSLEVLQRLSTVLGVPIASLVGEDPHTSGAPDDTVVLFRDLQKLAPEDRETIKLMMGRLQRRAERSED